MVSFTTFLFFCFFLLLQCGTLLLLFLSLSWLNLHGDVFDSFSYRCLFFVRMSSKLTIFQPFWMSSSKLWLLLWSHLYHQSIFQQPPLILTHQPLNSCRSSSSRCPLTLMTCRHKSCVSWAKVDIVLHCLVDILQVMSAGTCVACDDKLDLIANMQPQLSFQEGSY